MLSRIFITETCIQESRRLKVILRKLVAPRLMSTSKFQQKKLTLPHKQFSPRPNYLKMFLFTCRCWTF